jgi:uncharacterized protein (DUF2342 family)
MTAVEWLVEQLFKTYNNTTEKKIDNKSIIEQAKDMEKQQIIDANTAGVNQGLHGYKSAEEYYNKTFKKE